MTQRGMSDKISNQETSEGRIDIRVGSSARSCSDPDLTFPTCDPTCSETHTPRSNLEG